jgi:hypothetical protein
MRVWEGSFGRDILSFGRDKENARPIYQGGLGEKRIANAYNSHAGKSSPSCIHEQE